MGIPIKGDLIESEFYLKYQSFTDYDGQVCTVDNVSIENAFIKCVTVEEDGPLLQFLNIEGDQNGERKFLDIKLY